MGNIVDQEPKPKTYNFIEVGSIVIKLILCLVKIDSDFI